jgi:hypothetical protein
MHTSSAMGAETAQIPQMLKLVGPFALGLLIQTMILPAPTHRVTSSAAVSWKQGGRESDTSETSLCLHTR